MDELPLPPLEDQDELDPPTALGDWEDSDAADARLAAHAAARAAIARFSGPDLPAAPLLDPRGVAPAPPPAPTPFVGLPRDHEAEVEILPPLSAAERRRALMVRPLAGRGPLWLLVYGAIFAFGASLAFSGYPMPMMMGAFVLLGFVGLLAELGDESAFASLADESREPVDLTWRRPDPTSALLRGFLVFLGVALGYAPAATLLSLGVPLAFVVPLFVGPALLLPLFVFASAVRGPLHTLDLVFVTRLARALGPGYLRAVFPGALLWVGVAIAHVLLRVLITAPNARLVGLVVVGVSLVYGFALQAGALGFVVVDRDTDLAPLLRESSDERA